jgi:hypothetical protein
MGAEYTVESLEKITLIEETDSKKTVEILKEQDTKMQSIFESVKKYCIYNVTLYSILGYHLWYPNDSPWWNEIDTNLYLGAVPLRLMGHNDILKDLGINVIISLNEPFELNIDTKSWNDYNIDNIIIDAKDYHAVSKDKLILVVNLIKDLIIKHKKIYIHCKGGRGRSASVVICYLLKHGLYNGHKFNSIDEVMAYVKGKRSVINLNDEQLKSVINFYLTM